MLKIETNTEFQSMLKEFMCRDEIMCLITLHLIPRVVIPPNEHFIPPRDNTVPERKIWAAFSHSVNQIITGNQQRHDNDINIPYRYNGLDDYMSRSTFMPLVVEISNDESQSTDSFFYE